MWVSVRVQPLEGRKHGRHRIETSSGSIQPGNTRSHPWLVCSLENARPSRDIRNLPTHPSSILLSSLSTFSTVFHRDISLFPSSAERGNDCAANCVPDLFPTAEWSGRGAAAAHASSSAIVF